MAQQTLDYRSRREHHILSILRHLDYVLLVSTVLVALIGVVAVYSATRDQLIAAGISPYYYLERQAIWMVIGLAVMAVVVRIDYHHYESWAWIFYGLLILALLAVFVIGKHQLGAERWFQFGPVQVQPSAFGALILIIVIAAYTNQETGVIPTRRLFKLVLLAAVPILLVVKQPDLGSGIVMGVVLLAMLMVAETRARDLLILILGGLSAVVLVLHFGLLHQYQLQRLTGFLHQNQGARTYNYNLIQSKSTIGSGGFAGTGLFKGPETNLAYIPEQYTDFIFTAVGEQLGFIGAGALIGLYGIITWRILRAAQGARDRFGRMLCIGALALVAFSVFENVGMTMAIMPIAGIPLPLVSYGGSAVVAMMAAIGLTLNVQIRRFR
ncbi:MAG: rod shape-determining protein RodA [Actinobacteria bacterium]|nr:rod shape-determining protein RodA [Actinomycetota bacterium]